MNRKRLGASQQEPVLVVGAGPVGLAAAIEMTRRGCSVRVVEKRLTRSVQSKAIGINPRTLELLDASGITSRLLDRGVRFNEIRLGSEDKHFFSIQFKWLSHRYPFMLGLPQRETECLLEERLAELGVAVERGVELVGLRRIPGGTVVELRGQSGASEELTPPLVLGADGAHSTVRKRMGIGFPGTEMKGEWSLADIELDTDLDPEAAHVLFRNGRIVFLISFRQGLWRAASERPNVLEHLPPRTRIHKVIWSSDFKVSFRQAERYRDRNVFLCGDAAHIHSPLGARGMNMGIEDAAELAWRWETGHLDDYASSRHRATAAAIRMVKAQTWMATHHGRSAHWVRSGLLPFITQIPAVQSQMIRRMAGFGYSPYQITS